MTDHENYNPMDWRWDHHGPNCDNTMGMALLAIWCPFMVTLKEMDCIARYVHENAHFLQTGEDSVPICGYYGYIPGPNNTRAKVLITNYYGIWFKVQT